ncbi:helix-turn-helix domain-containing protein [Providencia rettgeri]|uniref:helix-turn-helix domain-containing protein n=1 Tax=Providencia rettgeri TaxID=587 RepID=UPI00235EE3CA|nr:helix-turn-helix transcriptional regulator [Providencia rettgeri]
MKKDWHPADIIAAIKKKGSSLSEISRSVGLNSSTLNNALSRRWPKGERIIAEFLGVTPAEIWPSRYHGREQKD